MPVILKYDEEKQWLDLNYPLPHKLLDPYPENDIEMYPVPNKVNKPINNSGDILEKRM